MNCDNCGCDLNDDDAVFAVHPKTGEAQSICRACDARIPWGTTIDPMLNKPVQYYGDLT